MSAQDLQTEWKRDGSLSIGGTPTQQLIAMAVRRGWMRRPDGPPSQANDPVERAAALGLLTHGKPLSNAEINKIACNKPDGIHAKRRQP